MLNTYFHVPSNWQVKKFEDLLAEPVRNGIYKKKEFHGRGTKMINMGELFAYDFISNQQMKRVELNSQELQKYILLEGDLLFARRSLVLEGSGKCSIVVQPSENTSFESSIIRARPNEELVDSKYYFYLFKSSIGRGLMASIATRTAVSGIRGSDLASLQVPYPPLSIQRKIAAILSAYDDLIENNTRRIQILEEMAQTIYREWFVHFRFPGHEAVRIVDSDTDLGQVPVGWKMRTLGDFGEVITGKTPSKKVDEYWNSQDVPFIRTPDMHNQLYCLQTTDYLSQAGADSQRNKYLPPNSLCVSCIGTVGIVTITGQRTQTNQQINSVVLTNPIDLEFLYFSILDMKETIQLYASTGATMSNLSRGKFIGLNLNTPTEELRSLYHKVVSPMFDNIKILQLKNENLRSTRDLLMPRLISGDVDISESEISY